MKRLIFATQNPGKVTEMGNLLRDLEIEVLTAGDAGVHEDVVEDGSTFEENALKKARFVSEQTGDWSVGGDSGLCIDALDGRPGIFTARWAGEGASGDELIAHTLRELSDVPEGRRQARFVCTLALVAPDGRHWTFTGEVEGRIVMEARGSALPKLPYDVIFAPTGDMRVFGEMSAEEKNAQSHRGRAFQRLKAFLASTSDLDTAESGS